MLIYIIIYSLLLISGIIDGIYNLSQKQKSIIFIFWIISFTLFRGLRWETGTDWEQFYYCFQHTTWDNIFTYSRSIDREDIMEPGYMILNWVIRQLGSYTIFLIITNFFLLLSYAYFSYKIAPRYSLLIFSAFFFFQNFFPIRQSLAAGILIWAYYYIYKTNLFKFLIIVFLSFTIHKTALILLPFYFLSRIRFPWYIILGSYTIFLMLLSEEITKNIMILIAGIVGDVNSELEYLIGEYINYNYNPSKIINDYISNFFNFFLLCIFCYCRKSITKNGDIGYLYNIFLNAFFIQSVFQRIFVNLGMGGLARINLYFVDSYPILLALSMIHFKTKATKLYWLCFLFLFCLYRFYNMTFHYPEIHFPYYSIFSF